MASGPHRVADRLRRVAAAAALALLASCAATAGPPAPTPAGAQAETIDLPAGPLALSTWRAEAPRAVLLALHGYGDYAPSTFDKAARAWAARGVTTYAYDQRGFGRNPSNRDWPGADALIEDAEEAAAWVAARHPGTPLFVLGHSMGGGVALAAAGEGRLPEASGLILLAPAVWGGDQLNLALRLSAWMSSQITPDTRFSGRGVVAIRPSDNIPMLRALAKDPLRFAAPSGREFMGLIRVMDRAVAAAPNADLPSLTVVGAHEQIVPPESIRAAYDLMPEPKTLAQPRQGWHMLLRDLHAAEVRDLVADWILKTAAATKRPPA